MPEIEQNRKRSRSPSDAELLNKNSKRANTGASATSTGPVSPYSPSRITMAPHPSSSSLEVANDTNSSTPNEENQDIKLKHEDQEDSKDNKDEATTSGEPSSTAPPPPAGNIHMRCLIVTQDASIIIGKGGSHVNEIREKSGARVMVSESIPGNPERILNVSGPLDAVSKVISDRLSSLLLHAHLSLYPIKKRLLDLLFAGSTMNLLMSHRCPEAGQSPSNS